MFIFTCIQCNFIYMLNIRVRSENFQFQGGACSMVGGESNFPRRGRFIPLCILWTFVNKANIILGVIIRGCMIIISLLKFTAFEKQGFQLCDHPHRNMYPAIQTFLLHWRLFLSFTQTSKISKSESTNYTGQEVYLSFWSFYMNCFHHHF